jgi:hypothetical protein
MYARQAAKALSDGAPIIRNAVRQLSSGPVGSTVVTFNDYQTAQREGALGKFDRETTRAVGGHSSVTGQVGDG